MTNSTKQPTNKYFDLHTTGIGYLNRIREVKKVTLSGRVTLLHYVVAVMMLNIPISIVEYLELMLLT